MLRQPLVAANWKMNGTLSENQGLISDIKSGLASDLSTEIVICPPYPYLPEIQRLLDGCGIQLGAQNVSEHESGAYTGEVSVSMLKDYGCTYVIVGHSERRNIYGESDHVVAEKFKMVVSCGMVPILCLGELLDEREAGITEEVVSRQLLEVINIAGIDSLKMPLSLTNRCGQLVRGLQRRRNRLKKYMLLYVCNWPGIAIVSPIE